jgi:hypothetical protein
MHSVRGVKREADESGEIDAGEAGMDDRATGLPSDWGRGHGVERYELPDEWVALMARYRGMVSEPLDRIFKVTVGLESPTRAVREREYIDEDYRDEYSNFYSKTYRELPSRSERLHFYVNRDDAEDTATGTDELIATGEGEREGRRYLGFVTLRPLIGRPVARTMIAPPWGLRHHVSCLAKATGTTHGFPVEATGFPFIQQDSQYGSCAHAAMWMVSLYFHLRYRRPRRHISDFVSSARVHQDVFPAVPTAGLTSRQISAVLHDLDMQPVIYRLDRQLPDEETAESIACRYLNSGLPVMLLSGGGRHTGHAQVLIGYGRDREGLVFIHHDDQRGPYLELRRLPDPLADGADEPATDAPEEADENADPDDEGEADADRWHALVVPLPGRIYLSGEVAEKTGKHIFQTEVARHVELRTESEPHDPGIAALEGGFGDGSLRVRSYLTEASDYKRALRGRGLPEDALQLHLNTNTSHWLWVIELQDRQLAERGRRCVVGEIVIDATSDDEWVNPLFGNLRGQLMLWPELGDPIKVEPFESDGEPYDSGTLLHVPS